MEDKPVRNARLFIVVSRNPIVASRAQYLQMPPGSLASPMPETQMPVVPSLQMPVRSKVAMLAFVSEVHGPLVYRHTVPPKPATRALPVVATQVLVRFAPPPV